ncbi:MAG: LysR family transcriptional regulator, partial [Rhodospirillales bacterium]|nr:LysR family transcriptional regulator [Rhodospirillales bacterium]
MTLSNGLDLRALNVFLETAQAGNMTEAAKRLGMTQPAVSQYISKIEAEIGAQLLDRRLRPIRLTPAGEVLRDRAEALMVSAEA